MTLIIDDNNKCECGAYWQTIGFCANGHPYPNKEKMMNPINIIEKITEQIKDSNATKIILTKMEGESLLNSLSNLYPDNCEICMGKKGGTKGNENIIDGKTMCDYCSVEHFNKQYFKKEEEKK